MRLACEAACTGRSLAGHPIRTFSVVFASEAGLFELANVYAKCVYEMINHEKWSTLKKEDTEYLFNPFLQDTDMANVRESDSESESSASENENECKQTRASTAHSDSEDGDPERQDDDGFQNKQLVVGYKHDRSFVQRGHSIGVFKHTSDNTLAFQTNIKSIKTAKGDKLFTPSKVGRRVRVRHGHLTRRTLAGSDDAARRGHVPHPHEPRQCQHAVQDGPGGRQGG